jgi:uncharacterized membrane protein YeaQ/YmgE (transglycosylase-associated protein family)
MGIIAWIIFGLIAGALARMLMPGDDPGSGSFGGLVITMLIGIVGAVVGGFVGAALGFGGVDGFNIGSFAIAVVGALIFLALWRAIAGGTRGGLTHA